MCIAVVDFGKELYNKSILLKELMLYHNMSSSKIPYTELQMLLLDYRNFYGSIHSSELPDGKSVYDYSNQDVFYAEVLGVKFVERERKNYYQLTLREPELSEWQKKLMECELLKKSPLNKF